MEKSALVGVLVLAALAAGVVRAQDSPPPAPTFRSEADYVQLPVRVLDASGAFVGGLTQSDFQVFEDGRPQTVTAFTAVDIPFIPADDSVPMAAVASVDPVASNESAHVDGRVYLFVLDDRHTEPGDTPLVRRLVQGFIRDKLSANDISAVVMTGSARGQDFTRNRSLLLEAVDRFVGDFESADSLRSYRVLSTIAGLSEWMGSIKGRRKALVFVTPGAFCSLRDPDCSEPLRHALRMAMQSDVSIYAIDPRGSFAGRGSRAENARFEPFQEVSRAPVDDGARYLADESGGFAIINTNSFGTAFDRLVRDNSAYYLIGYYSTNSRADGRFRKNEVKVARPGVEVIHRSGYSAAAAAKPVDGGNAGTTATRETVVSRLRELERSPLPVSAMALRVAAAPFLAAGGSSRVSVIVEMPNQTLRPTDQDGRFRLNVGLSINLYDRDGKVVGGEDPNIDLNLPLAAGPRVTAEGIRFVSRITVPPGAYRLLVAATQTPSGVGGSVMTEVHVPDFDRQPLALSGIAVTTTGALRMYTARTDELIDDVLGAPPVAHREFPADEDLWVYGEIYDRRSDAGDVTATVIVRSADGTVVYETPFEPAPVQFGHLASVPLGRLGPGSYVATIEARSVVPSLVEATRAVAFRVR